MRVSSATSANVPPTPPTVFPIIAKVTLVAAIIFALLAAIAYALKWLTLAPASPPPAPQPAAAPAAATEGVVIPTIVVHEPEQKPQEQSAASPAAPPPQLSPAAGELPPPTSAMTTQPAPARTIVLRERTSPMDICGYWKSSDLLKRLRSIVFVFEHEGKPYIKTIASYSDGSVVDTIDCPTVKVTSLPGVPSLCGLDCAWSLIPNKENTRYIGKILNPDDGKVRDVEIWTEKGKLKVNVKVLFGAGPTLDWEPATDADFQGHPIPDTSQLIPNIPRIKQ